MKMSEVAHRRKRLQHAVLALLGGFEQPTPGAGPLLPSKRTPSPLRVLLTLPSALGGGREVRQPLPGFPRGCPGSAGTAGLPRHTQAVSTTCLENEEESAVKFLRSQQDKENRSTQPQKQGAHNCSNLYSVHNRQ